MPMTDQDVQDFVTKFAAAWAARDGEAFLAMWHPEGRLHYPLVNRTLAGSEIARLNQVQKETVPDLVWQLLDWTSRGNTVMIEWQCTRVTNGIASNGAGSTSYESRMAGFWRSGFTWTPRRCVQLEAALHWNRCCRFNYFTTS
jgi:hypothetical protein